MVWLSLDAEDFVYLCCRQHSDATSWQLGDLWEGAYSSGMSEAQIPMIRLCMRLSHAATA